MKVFRTFFVCLLAATFSIHSIATELSREQQESVSTLFELLFAIYDYDASLVPDEPNEILALETSSDSRDLLAWEIFKLIRYELDPSSKPLEEIDTAAEEVTAGSEMDLLSSEGFSTMALLSESEPAVDLTGPLDSCILERQTYRITQLPLEIEGHVVIPAGTRLIAPYDPNSNIIEILPGGLLDMGRASFYSAQDYPDVLPPVEILQEDPNIPFYHNGIGIYVYRGADPRTRIENVEISGCRTGIVIDEALDYPLRQVITTGCYDGLHLYAPGSVIDCQFWYNGSVWYWMSEYIMAHFSEYMNGTLFEDPNVADHASVAVYICPDSEAFPYPEISIERTLLDSADVGLYIEGIPINPSLPDPNEMAPHLPRVQVKNSCLSLTYFYGLYQSEGQAVVEAEYTAFADNEYYNTNLDLPYTGCFVIGYDPFYSLSENWRRLYVAPSSHLIDAGYGLATDGTGTCHNWPDVGILDIGCHFPLAVSGGFGIASSPSDFNWDGTVDDLDLELMNACMGATDDPNLLRMDFNWDSWINMPDYGVLASYFGCTADPNLPGSYDPNSEWSDFNEDLQVDLEDLATMAEHWLTPVFDEYRICSLCNLHTGPDPNDPNAPTGLHIIDERDRDVFMEDWGHNSIVECTFSFKDSFGSDNEPNSLSDVVTLCLEEYPPSTWMFLRIDGEWAGETYADDSLSVIFEIPTYEYNNGSHVLTIGGYTPDGGCWIQKVPVEFQNWFYLADIPEMYKPEELYKIRGFFDCGILSISADPNVYNMSTDGYMDFQMYITDPNSVITLTYEAEEPLLLMQGQEDFGMVFAMSSSGIQTKNVTPKKEVDMSGVDPNSYRALIVAPDEDANDDFQITLEAIRIALDLKGIPYIELLYKNATWDNISIALRGGNLNYVYWIGHTNSQIGEERDPFTKEVLTEGIHRTNFRIWKINRILPDSQQDRIFSFVKSDNPPEQPNLDPLPDGWDVRGHSMYSLELWKTKKIKEFWAIGCESGVPWENAGSVVYSNGLPINDMAGAVGAYYKDQQGNYVHVYIGTRFPVWTGWLMEKYADFPGAIAHIIQRHSNNHNLDDALINGPNGSDEHIAIWGSEGLDERSIQWWPVNTKRDWIQFY